MKTMSSPNQITLGVRVTGLDPVLAEQHNLTIDRGALIVDVTSNGPAAQAGLRPGDVMVSVDNKEVKDVASLGDVLLSKKPGDVVQVQAQRGSQQLTVSVELGELRVE